MSGRAICAIVAVSVCLHMGAAGIAAAPPDAPLSQEQLQAKLLDGFGEEQGFAPGNQGSPMPRVAAGPNAFG